MKVAIISEWLDAWRGGAETSTLQFIHHLREEGVDVHVFTRSRPSPAPGLSVHTVSGAAMSRTRQSITFAHRVENRIRNEAFDIVHAITPCKGADFYQPRGGLVAEVVERNLALMRSRTGKAVRRAASLLNLKKRWQLVMEREILSSELKPIVIAISDYVIRQLQRHYAFPRERVHKVYNGVDPDVTVEAERHANRTAIRREFGIAERDILVLMVAHNFRLKGVAQWMHALAELHKDKNLGIRSIVVGKGDSGRWHKLAARLGLTNVLTFAGPSDRVPAFRHASDVLVHPTFYDPCSRVVLEALSAALPCVASRWDGASEMIQEGKNGYLIDDPSDCHAIADRVRRLCDPELRSQMAAFAKNGLPDFSMARHCREMMQLYVSHVGQHSEAS